MSANAVAGDAFDDELATKYEWVELLGRGGMGIVVLARHRELGELFAIKLLARNLATFESTTRFRREARASASIRSRHVPRVTDAGVLANGQPFIIMEFLRGSDLAHLIEERGPLPAHEAVDFVLQALEAIAEAHSLGIVHRDIKPSNLFATSEPSGETTIKVLDFGLAKLLEGMDSHDVRLTESGGVLGTPSYMSPEQFVGAQDVDARADVWGIGVTLFELLTAQAPFRGNGVAQLYTAVMHRPIPRVRTLRADVPAGLDEVVSICLSRERGERYASVASLARALEPYAGESAHARVQRIGRVLADTAPSSEPAADSSAATRDANISRAALDVPPDSIAMPRLQRWPLWAAALIAVSVGAVAIARSTGSDRAPRVGRAATAVAQPATETSTRPATQTAPDVRAIAQERAAGAGAASPPQIEQWFDSARSSSSDAAKPPATPVVRSRKRVPRIRRPSEVSAEEWTSTSPALAPVLERSVYERYP